MNRVRSSRMRPDSWSTSYLLRSPFGISTSTSNSTDSTFRQTRARDSPGTGHRSTGAPGLVSRTIDGTRTSKGAVTTIVGEQRHWLVALPVRFLAEIVVLLLLRAAVVQLPVRPRGPLVRVGCRRTRPPNRPPYSRPRASSSPPPGRPGWSPRASATVPADPDRVARSRAADAAQAGARAPRRRPGHRPRQRTAAVPRRVPRRSRPPPPPSCSPRPRPSPRWVRWCASVRRCATCGPPTSSSSSAAVTRSSRARRSWVPPAIRTARTWSRSRRRPRASCGR